MLCLLVGRFVSQQFVLINKFIANSLLCHGTVAVMACVADAYISVLCNTNFGDKKPDDRSF